MEVSQGRLYWVIVSINGAAVLLAIAWVVVSGSIEATITCLSLFGTLSGIIGTKIRQKKTGPKGDAMNQEDRNKDRIAKERERWVRIRDKLLRIEKQRDEETRTEEKYRLDSLITDTRKELDDVEEKLKVIEGLR